LYQAFSLNAHLTKLFIQLTQFKRTPPLKLSKTFTVVKNIFTVVKNIFTVVKNISTVVKNIFIVVKNISTVVKNISTVVKNIFTVVKNIFTVVKNISTVVKKIFTVIKKIFSVVKKMGREYKKSCSPPCKKYSRQPKNRFYASLKTVVKKNILHFGCSKMYHLVPFCPRNQIFTIKEGGSTL